MLCENCLHGEINFRTKRIPVKALSVQFKVMMEQTIFCSYRSSNIITTVTKCKDFMVRYKNGQKRIQDY